MTINLSKVIEIFDTEQQPFMQFLGRVYYKSYQQGYEDAKTVAYSQGCKDTESKFNACIFNDMSEINKLKPGEVGYIRVTGVTEREKF